MILNENTYYKGDYYLLRPPFTESVWSYEHRLTDYIM